MDNLSFEQYFGRFDKLIKDRGGKIIKLSNGARVAILGKGKRVVINSGIHGDERSGPLAILEWLEAGIKIKTGAELVISPLINDWGWDRKTRLWQKTDLNTVFNKSGPKFVQELMDIWQENIPVSFLDIHEDDEYDGAYLFRFKGDKSSWVERLAKTLSAEIEDWVFEEWSDNSESFIKKLGCNRATTIESPPTWPLAKRVEWNKKAINWCYNNYYGKRSETESSASSRK